MKLFLVLVVCASLLSCTAKNDPGLGTTPVQAYVPQYLSASELQQITIQAARATRQPGKIYAFGNYLFQNDLQQGIHIIDNTDRMHPAKLAFLQVLYSTEMAIKSNFLYTNNLNDLVVFDISTIQSPRLVKRMANVFPAVNQKYPPFINVSFECPDPAKGVVVGWELKTTSSARCRR